jgi:hypothetical protein
MRLTDVADRPEPSKPRCTRASDISPVLMPLRYSQGTRSSIDWVLRRYGGRILLVKRNRTPFSSVRRSSTRGGSASMGPKPDRIALRGLGPLRTTSPWPASSS